MCAPRWDEEQRSVLLGALCSAWCALQASAAVILHCPQLCRARDPGWEESRTPTLYVTLPIQFGPRYLCSLLHDQTNAKPWSVFIRFAERSIAGFWAWVFSQIGQAVSVPTFLCLLFDAKYVFISWLDHLGISSATCGTVKDFPGTISGGGRSRNWEMRSDNWHSLFIVQSLSRVQLCDPMSCSTPGFPDFHHLLMFAQTHVHWVSDVI